MVLGKFWVAGFCLGLNMEKEMISFVENVVLKKSNVFY